VLGYLLKHAHLALEHRAQAALADIGVTVRDLGVLRVIASGEAQSQQEAAAVLGVDRTSMVALLDALERQGSSRAGPRNKTGAATSSRSPTTAGRCTGRQRTGTPRPSGTSRRR
jgi:DNA-binding MarR family transcriptional regulator